MKKILLLCTALLILLACSFIAGEHAEELSSTSTSLPEATNTPVPTLQSTPTAILMPLPNPLVDQWTWTNIETQLDISTLFPGFDQLFWVDGTISFLEDESFEVFVSIDVDVWLMFTVMGFDDAEMSSEHVVVSIIGNGSYSLISGDSILVSFDSLESALDPEEFCMTLAGNTECKTNADLDKMFALASFDSPVIYSFQVADNSLTVWDENCSGSDQECALRFNK